MGRKEIFFLLCDSSSLSLIQLSQLSFAVDFLFRGEGKFQLIARQELLNLSDIKILNFEFQVINLSIQIVDLVLVVIGILQLKVCLFQKLLGCVLLVLKGLVIDTLLNIVKSGTNRGFNCLVLLNWLAPRNKVDLNVWYLFSSYSLFESSLGDFLLEDFNLALHVVYGSDDVLFSRRRDNCVGWVVFREDIDTFVQGVDLVCLEHCYEGGGGVVQGEGFLDQVIEACWGGGDDLVDLVGSFSGEQLLLHVVLDCLEVGSEEIVELALWGVDLFLGSVKLLLLEEVLFLLFNIENLSVQFFLLEIQFNNLIRSIYRNINIWRITQYLLILNLTV